MAYSDVEKFANAAASSAGQAQASSGDAATRSTAEAIEYLGHAIAELAAVLRRTDR